MPRPARDYGEAGAVPPTVTYVLADAGAITVSLGIAHLLRFGLSAALLPGPNVPYVLVAVLAVPVWLGVLTLAGCYDRNVLGVGSDEYRRVLNGGVHFLAVVALAHFLGRLVIARGYVGMLIPVALVLTLLVRVALRAWLRRQRRRGRYVHRLLLAGTPEAVAEVGRQLVRSEWSGYRLVGVCADVAGGRWRSAGAPSRWWARCPRRRRGRGPCGADAVAVTAETRPGELGVLASEVAGRGIDLLVAPAVTEVAAPRMVERDTGGLTLLHVEEPTFTGPQRLAKEVFDRVSAVLALVALGPVFAVVAVAVTLDSPGPVFFRQTRVARRAQVLDGEVPHDGRRRRERCSPTSSTATRPTGCCSSCAPIPGDPGRPGAAPLVHRRAAPDRQRAAGDMSLVGPRPPLPGEVEIYEGHVSRRLLVKPGITGLWQVSGRSDLPWDEAVRLDLYYVDHWSPTMDLTIMAKTFSAGVGARGAGGAIAHDGRDARDVDRQGIG